MKTLIAFACIVAISHAVGVTLSWRDNSDNEDAFVIERSLDGVAFVQIGATPADVIAYEDTVMVNEKAYAYRVKATNAYGSSGYTKIVFYVPDGMDWEADGWVYEWHPPKKKHKPSRSQATRSARRSR